MSSTHLSQRNPALDLLRILAAVSVVTLHCTAFYLGYEESGTLSFHVLQFANQLSKIGVPLFAMVSGALFLDPAREVSLGRLWKHSILRIFVVYFLWCFVYDAGKIVAALGVGEFSDALYILLDAPYHLWFLPMIAGLYALTPMLRTYLKSAEERELRYFFLLYYVSFFGSTFLLSIAQGENLRLFAQLLQIAPICNYIGYYLLGSCLLRYGLPERARKVRLPVGIAAALLSYRLGDPFGLVTGFLVVALFSAACERLGTTGETSRREDPSKQSASANSRPRLDAILSGLAKDMFGVYLMHLLFMTFFNRALFQYGTIEIPKFVLALLQIVLCTAASTAVSAVLRRIPFLGRYLV